MAVPEEIRNVERPKNTVVVDQGKDGPHRWAVRERSGIKYISHGNPQPHNGKVIGHIIDGKYVPRGQKVVKQEVEALSWGAAALVHSFSSDLKDDLLQIFSAEDVFKIMAIASLRVIVPGVSNSRLMTEYRRTYVSQFYPGTRLSQATVCKFLQKLGECISLRHKFFELRLQRVCAQHHIVIDGMLKQDNSKVNDLSAFSFKGRIKGTRDISVIYAYDLELMEPVCCEVFSGNTIDASAYSYFIRDNNVNKGIIVADKGFPPSQIASELKDRPQLHFLTPIKRNDTRIKTNAMLDFTEVLEGVEGHILCKKQQIKGGHFLYSFRDLEKSKLEEKTFIEQSKIKQNFDSDKYAKKCPRFGTLVLESDLDLSLLTAYKAYEDRWKIELVFDFYKNEINLDETRVQSDFSVQGSEFINYISTVLTCRIINKATNTSVLKQISYKDLISDLSTAWRKVNCLNTPSRGDDSFAIRVHNDVNDLMEQMGIQNPSDGK